MKKEEHYVMSMLILNFVAAPSAEVKMVISQCLPVNAVTIRRCLLRARPSEKLLYPHACKSLELWVIPGSHAQTYLMSLEKSQCSMKTQGKDNFIHNGSNLRLRRRNEWLKLLVSSQLCFRRLSFVTTQTSRSECLVGQTLYACH